MPPKLRSKLVYATLDDKIERFKDFFTVTDFHSLQKESSDEERQLITEIMSHLHVKIYGCFFTVIKAGVKVDQVYMIDKGEVNIIDRTGLFILATLPRGSFFGE